MIPSRYFRRSTLVLALTLGIAMPAAYLKTSPAYAFLGPAGYTLGGSILIRQAGKEFGSAIQDAKAAAEVLIGRADEVAKARLDQIDLILQKTIIQAADKSENAVLNILYKAKNDVFEIENKIFEDMKSIIWRIECAGKKLTLEDSKDALGKFGTLIGTHEIKLTPPKRVLKEKWFCIFGCDPYTVKIQTPFGETFKQIQTLMEGSIADSEIDDDTPAYDIVGTYEYLSSLALRTSCFYEGSSDTWNRVYVDYREKAREWTRILAIDPV